MEAKVTSAVNGSIKSTLPIGTVSEGTLRDEDLFDEFLWMAKSIRLSRDERQVVRTLEINVPQDEEALGEAVGKLTNILENHVPDYCYFGALEGDGACFGVWVDWPSIEQARLDGEIATRSASINQYALEVNDHGNATLYRRAGTRWVEVWAVV